MKITLSRETLLKPLQTVIGVIGQKQAMPILANILFTIKDNQLTLTGTDGEIELIGSADLVDNPLPNIALTMPARKLLDICRTLPGETSIELSQQKENIILRAEQSRFTLATLPAENFPYLATSQGNLSFSMPQYQLKVLLQRCCFAMAQKDLRYFLNGVLLEIAGNQVRAVATDGHRLASSTIEVTTNASQTMQIIIPRKAVLELLRLLKDDEETIGITLNNQHLRINAEEFCFTSKLLEGEYPKYERAIPKQNNQVILIDRELFGQALGRTAVICDEDFKGARFQIANNRMEISTLNPQQESAEEKMAVAFTDTPLDITFNVTYLIDVINVLESSMIQLKFLDSKTSVVIEEVENPWKSFFVVMPIHI